MQYMVQVSLKPGVKNQVVDVFEVNGPNRNPHVRFLKAWLGARTDVAFVLVSSEQESHVTDACCAWSELGETTVFPVIDIEAY